MSSVPAAVSAARHDTTSLHDRLELVGTMALFGVGAFSIQRTAVLLTELRRRASQPARASARQCFLERNAWRSWTWRLRPDEGNRNGVVIFSVRVSGSVVASKRFRVYETV